jgi:hypothetical protein
VVEARCAHPGHLAHQAPAVRCSCGIYALDSLATVHRAVRWFRQRHWGLRGAVVFGAVQLWGGPGRPVVVGELAGRPGLQYRAPYARMVALADSGRAAKVGEQLGIPVVRAEGLELYAREFGEQLHPPPASGVTILAGRAARLGARLAWAGARWAAPLLLAGVRHAARLAWALTKWAAPHVWTGGRSLGRAIAAAVWMLAGSAWLLIRLLLVIAGAVVESVLEMGFGLHEPAPRRR